MRITRRRVVEMVCVVLSVLGIVCPASGADDLEITRTNGAFKEYIMENTWTQRWAEVQNHTASPRTVEVVFESKHPTAGQLQYSATAEVSPKSSRQVFVDVRPAELSALGREIGARRQFEETAVLVDGQTGERLGQNTTNVLQAQKRDTFIPYALGGKDNQEDEDTIAYLKDLQGAPLGSVTRMSSSAGLLPDRWYGYAMVDVMTIGNVPDQKLLPSQTEAMLDWVRRGGVLLISGSAGLSDVLSGPLGRAAGVAPAGMHRITKLQVEGLNANNIKPVALDWPVPLTELCPGEAQVLLTGNDLPLLTVNRLGSGHVFVLAVPTGAIKDPSLHAIWQNMNPSRLSSPSINADAFDEPGRQALNEIAGRPAPSSSIPLVVLGTIAGLATIGGVTLNLLRRGELLWVALVPVALATGLVLWNIGRSSTTEERLSHISLITGLEEGKARVQCTFGYYSGRKTQEATFSAGTYSAVIQDTILKAQGAFGRSRITSGATNKLPQRVVPENSTALFTVDSVVQTGGIGGVMTFDEAGLVGKLTNQLGTDIDKAVIYINDHTYELGHLPHDMAVDVSVGPNEYMGPVTLISRRLEEAKSTTWQTPPPPEARPKRTPGQPTTKPTGPQKPHVAVKTITLANGEWTSGNQQDTLRNELMAHMVAQNSHIDLGRPTIVGGTSTSVIDPLPGRNLKRQGKSVVTWPLSLTAPPANTKVLIPEGFVSLSYPRLEGYPSLWNTKRREFNRGQRPGAILVSARAPNVVSAMKDAKLTVQISITAPSYTMRIWGVDGAGNIQDIDLTAAPLEEVASPSSTITLKIEDADKYMQPDGSYVLMIKVDNTGTPASPEVADPGKPKRVSVVAPKPWTINRIDVRIEGTTR